MQPYAEGFDILRNKGFKESARGRALRALNMPDIAKVWRRGSVISFRLLDLDAPAGWCGNRAYTPTCESALTALCCAAMVFARYSHCSAPQLRRLRNLRGSL